MSQEYIKTEIEKILQNKDYKEPLNAVMSCIWLAGNLKGTNLKIIKLGQEHFLCDYFAIASASNSTQLEAMKDSILSNLKSFNIIASSVEGSGQSSWILLDFGDFFVHLFDEEGRKLYDLDKLYQNQEQVEIPQSYYYSAPQIMQETSKEENYF